MLQKEDNLIESNKSANKILTKEMNSAVFKRLHLLISFLIKKGKKHLIENALRKAFIKVGVQTDLTKNELLVLAFNNITPVIDLLRRGSFSRFKEKTFISLLDLTPKKLNKASFWLAEGISSKKARSLSEKINLELLDISQKKGFSYEKLKFFYTLAKEQENKTVFYKKKKVEPFLTKKQGSIAKKLKIKKVFTKKKINKSR